MTVQLVILYHRDLNRPRATRSYPDQDTANQALTDLLLSPEGDDVRSAYTKELK